MRGTRKLLIFGTVLGLLGSGCGLNNGSRTKSEQLDGVNAGFSSSNSGYELNRAALMGTCPFLSETNPFNFDSILSSIRSQLQTKIEGQDACRSKQQFLSDGFTQIQQVYGKLDQDQAWKNSADLYQVAMNDMQLQLQSAQKLSTPDATLISTLQSGIFTMQDKIRELHVQSTSSHEQNQAELRIQMFSRMNDMLVSLSHSDPKCIDAIGGWKSLLPSFLGAASLAGGYSITSGNVMVSSALQLLSSLSSLLQSQGPKQAFQDIVRLQNEKVLACTYYSIQHSSCEVQRALKLVEEKKSDIKRIAFRQFAANVPKEWPTFLDLYSKMAQFESVFNTIASQGSSLSLEVDVVASYFASLSLNLQSLQPYPAPTAPEQELKSWLDRARRNGVRVSTVDGLGNPLTTKQQFERALQEIANKESEIQLIESKLKESKSFESLKHSLNALSPEVEKIANQMHDFLLEQAALLPEKDRGAVYVSAQTMGSLATFLATGVTDVNQPTIDNYLDRLSTNGSDLFKWISMGSVAQISKQQVLALGGKAQERLRNAFQVIDNRFGRQDIEDMKNEKDFKDTFSKFKQEYLLFFQLANVYNDIKGPSSAFRQSEVNVAYNSFESGFDRELEILIETKLEQPGGAHFCSLLSGFLTRNNSSLLNKCKAKFKTLEISTLSYEKKEDIDYGNACYYDDFVRRTRSFQILDALQRSL